jgi:hypothetical protein
VPTTTFQGSSVTTRQIAPDALGTIWVSQGPDEFLTGFQVSSGAPLYTFAYAPGSITGVAVDKANNVWLSNAVTANPSIYQYKYGTGGYTPETYTAEPAGGFAPASLTIDANQNIWIAAYTTNGTRADVLANLTPGSTPSYTTSGKSITPVSATFASSASGPLGLAVDASGDAWYGITGSNSVTTTGIEEVVPVLTRSVLTGLSPQTLIANATLGAKASQIPAIDGAGTLYLADNQGSGTLGIHVYSTVAVAGSNTGGQVLSPPGGYLGCYLATASTTACATGTSSAVYNPNNVEVDSTGSVWAPIASGGFTQLVGLGAPTWPLLATGKPGVSPGNSAATPLP